MPYLVGVTGSIGCGKSSVTRLLGEMGAFTLDADRLAREVLAPGSPGLARVAARFGADLLLPDPSATGHRLDRARLAERVFADPVARADLEAIVHPGVFGAMAAALARFAAEPAPDPPAIAALEIPLLLETGAESLCDLVVVVACNASQRERLEARGGLSGTVADRIIARQMPEAEKCRRAHRILDNSGDFAATREQTRLLWREIDALRRSTATPRAWPTRWETWLAGG